MDQHQPQEILYVALTALEPLQDLNAFRARLGLPPSRHLISSVANLQQPQGENSRAYQGNVFLRRNIPAAIADEQNCRLWITGLPPTCTVHQLLKCISIGPIYACHINEPNSTGPKIWETAAASLTFFTADAANRFLALDAVQRFTVEGHVTRMVRHRIRTESVYVNGRSRVLRIVGDPNIVQPEYLSRIFSEGWEIRFDTDYMRFTADEEGKFNEIIWAFGSFRAQAHVIYMNINKFFAGRAQAMYIADPCVQGGYEYGTLS
ncbi:hypothetical protein E0Z10_g3903 [Xylaria hypoxylon]|uniref:RRM domain-containing protein n=1 Tax=Xylaria hypoxylon TaxID=37992 RepID=A0A4Z0Z021_9PEZI|nr:hypothetical protein E0Z10_g3903 [Xylaria hypoxylon]